ncbi:MT-A70-domain-containing protein [Phlyctochytrium arcticum]|nr:MT-A70-domain-containing protein [Phlyctochytrium arcticum]
MKYSLHRSPAGVFSTSLNLEFNDGLPSIVRQHVLTTDCVDFLPMSSTSLLEQMIEHERRACFMQCTPENISELERALKTIEFWDNERFLTLTTAQLEEGPRMAITDVNCEQQQLRTLNKPYPTLVERTKFADPVHTVAVRLTPLPKGLEDVNQILYKSSFKESEECKLQERIHNLLYLPSARLSLEKEKLLGFDDVKFRPYCDWTLKSECARRNGKVCPKVHFRRIIRSHTDTSLGDCSYLNTCYKIETYCKYIHYELDEPGWVVDIEHPIPVIRVRNTLPAQWICCDVRAMDFGVLGKFAVIMADPPWDIHMSLPYGTMTDEEMKNMPLWQLQDDGFLFLWVTGRAMELGRTCMKYWGYKRVNEIIWVKIMQLQKLIRTGRTGHWLNHSKEHCLVGMKGDPKNYNPGLDTDVIVAEVRETSRKPDEIYRLIERLCPGTRKIEIFGRQHNTRDGWLTLGNQLQGSQVSGPDLYRRIKSQYPDAPVNFHNAGLYE